MNTLCNFSIALACILIFAPANLTAQQSIIEKELAARDTRKPYPDSDAMKLLSSKARAFFESKSA